MQKLFYLFALLLFASVIGYHTTHSESFHEEEGERESSKREDIQGAIDYYKQTSSDIETGEIPYDKLFKAIEIGRERVAERSKMRSVRGNLANLVWRERGPNNRGGRTRAIMIDSTNHNRIWTGGVSGGIWRTEDITADEVKWDKLGIYFESLSISDICQDPNNFSTIYAATGESYTGDVRGAGIFKSTDDGATWTLMPSTEGANNVLSTVNEIYIHSNGDIYACTSDGGILRSQDNGNDWEQVAGVSLNGQTSNNFHDFYYHQVDHNFYACNDYDIIKSATGNRNDWVSIGRNGTGFMNNVTRIEFAICPSDPTKLAAIGNVNSFSSNTFISSNGGQSWITRSVPDIFGGYGQAWYDLDITMDPFNCGRMLAGGVVLSETSFQAFSWSSIAQNVHSDHHNITFDPSIFGRVYFSNDGGIWLSTNGGQTVTDKSDGYVTTQFYACAIHPAAGSPYVMGGTQDNNSLIIDDAGLSPSRIAKGGDGMFCFIDQTHPDTQIVSAQYGDYALSTNGGQSFGFGADVNGDFVNRAGYDNNAHILYGQTNEPGADFFRWTIGGETEFVDITTSSIPVSAVLADPNVANRIYFGGTGGRVIRVDNANNGLSVGGTIFADLPANASVSCVYIDKLKPADALISLFSFGGGLKNIWMSTSSGAEWFSIEGDLPDLPVRWAIFDPTDHDKAMIATDAGVWTTDDINGDNTHWEPTNPDNGMPFVRVDMLMMRESDKVVLAATYGRGLMTTDVFAAPAAVIITQPIAYEGQSVVIDGSGSVNAQSYQWDFGDNTTSTEAKVNHLYALPGIYTIKLFINGNPDLDQTKIINILPYLPAPYQSGITSNWAGDFETLPEHFAAYSPNGSHFVLGVSDKPGKDGTHSGSKAWVLDPNSSLYQDNSRAELYTPMYDLSTPGLYELKFWTKYAVQARNDGFQLEYSLNGGASWTQLGNKEDDAGWYNYDNANLSDGAFPTGKSYFTFAQLEWKQYIKDISFLVGQAHVSFRYVFRSDGSERAQGVAIDDFEVTKYDGELKTTVTIFNADYTSDQEVTLNWTTGVEYQCKTFHIERSYTGVGFEEVKQVAAKGKVSTHPNSYTATDPSLYEVIYYRLRVINENTTIPYYYEFFSDTVIVRRNVDENLVYNVFPTLFSDQIFIGFSSFVNDKVVARIFDMSGKLVRKDEVVPNNISYIMNDLDLPQGVYMLSVQIGDGDIESYKMFTAGY